MATLSVGQRVVMHLYRYKHVDPSDIYNIPWDLTQDGIAASLRISRAHASIELKKLREADKVDEKLAHIKSGKIKRKAYLLTSLGLDEVPKIQEYARKENIDIDALLDMKKQDPAILLSELNEEDRFALGCACAFRVPVPLSVLPPTKDLIIPSDSSGRTVISDQLRQNIIGTADADEVIRWMQYASNKWLDDKREHIIGDEVEYAEERLFSMVKADLTNAACKLVSDEFGILTTYANEDIADLLDMLEPVPAKFAEVVYSARAEVHIALNEPVAAGKTIECLRGVSPMLADLYDADIAYASGDREKAVSIVSTVSDSIPAARTRLGRYLIDEGRYDEAEDLLMSLSVGDDGYAYIGIDKFIQLARIYHARGDDTEAYHKLMKAKASFSSESLKKRISAVAKMYDVRL